LRVLAARRSLGTVARVVVLANLVLWLVGPILWIAIASLQQEGSLTSVPLSLRLEPNLEGYTTLLGDPRWLHSLWISLQVVAATTVLALVIGALAAYPLSRYRIPGQRAIVTVLALTQMVPAIVLVIPVLLMFQWLRLKDTVASLVIVNVAFWIPLVVWLLKNVFDAVPRSMERAARMDGCTRIRTLFSITLPAARPGVAAVAVLLIIGTWNEFLFAMILGDREAVTVTRWIGFIESFTTAGLTRDPPYHLLATAGILTTLPCLVLALLFQRQIMSGLTEGHLKG
jgi:multiple sugar transport system permease protein